MLTCAITAILYPYCTLNEYTSFSNSNFLVLMAGEVIMFFDIVFNMLLAYKDDNDRLYVTNIKKIS